MPDWVKDAIGIGGLLGTLVTAVATFFLWRVTQTLALETERMAEAAAQPHVVATLGLNRWAMNHFDLHVDNTGNATAYGIEVSFDPELINGQARRTKDIPLQRISVLKPGQGMTSYVCEAELLADKTFNVRITWRKSSSSADVQSNAYVLNMSEHKGISRLGSEPLVQIATHVKKLEEGFSKLNDGRKKIQVDVFTSSDRLHERRHIARERRAWQEQRRQEQVEASSLEAATPSDN